MKIQITWLKVGVVQVKELTRCKQKDGFFLMNSLIYKAIEDGSFCIDMGEFGTHPFSVVVLSDEP